jgi:hypothetical protein
VIAGLLTRNNINVIYYVIKGHEVYPCTSPVLDGQHQKKGAALSAKRIVEPGPAIRRRMAKELQHEKETFRHGGSSAAAGIRTGFTGVRIVGGRRLFKRQQFVFVQQRLFKR